MGKKGKLIVVASTLKMLFTYGDLFVRKLTQR
jgi:hypothetical protein